MLCSHMLEVSALKNIKILWSLCVEDLLLQMDNKLNMDSWILLIHKRYTESFSSELTTRGLRNQI